MYYEPEKNDHGLRYTPFKAIISPRPIAWVSTQDTAGQANLGPYSFFNAICDRPCMVGFNSGARKIGLDEGKDSLANIRQTGEFGVSIVSAALQDQMNISSSHFPHGVDEFEKAGLTKMSGKHIKAPLVAESPVNLECKLFDIIDFPGGHASWIMGTVIGIHIDDAVIKDGRVDVASYQPLARLGYKDYTKVETVFELQRPDE